MGVWGMGWPLHATKVLSGLLQVYFLNKLASGILTIRTNHVVLWVGINETAITSFFILVSMPKLPWKFKGSSLMRPILVKQFWIPIQQIYCHRLWWEKCVSMRNYTCEVFSGRNLQNEKRWTPRKNCRSQLDTTHRVIFSKSIIEIGWNGNGNTIDSREKQSLDKKRKAPIWER